MKAGIIQKLEEILATAEVNTAVTKIKDIQREYEQAFSKEMEEAKQLFVDEGGKARDFVYKKSEEDTRIVELFDQFRKLKKAEDEKTANELQKNYEIKLQLISDINDLSKLETNVGSAIKKLHELQAKWKEISNVSPHKYKELQSNYSNAVEGFYYNLNIFKELQNHDLKRNLELKSELLQKLVKLQESEQIKDVEQLVKVYRNEWDEIGPVPNEKWAELRENYRSAIEALYAKIKTHYNQLEDQKKQNLDLKKSVVEKALLLAVEIPSNEEEWKKKTDTLIALQDEYKKIGFTEKAAGDEVYKQFRSVCDSFFDAKKEFYAELKEKSQVYKAQKLEIIEQAEALQSSTDWKNTTDKLIKLQEKWKKTPSSGHEEQRLFQRFRKACNTFFDAKKASFEALDAQYLNNLVTKEEIITKIQTFTLSGNVSEDILQLKQFSEEWKSAGLVPAKDKQRVNEAFYKRLDELYEQLELDRNEKALIKFSNKIERLRTSENGEGLLRKERDFLKKNMDEINNNIRTYENNMGFFKNSKGKNTFLDEINEKIELEKKKLEEFKGKHKLVNEALQQILS